MKKKVVSIPDDIYSQIEHYSQKYGMNKNSVMLYLLREAINNRKAKSVEHLVFYKV